MRIPMKVAVPILIKVASIVAVTVGLNLWLNTLHEAVVNDLALYQMTDAPDSSSVIYLYSTLMNYLWVVPVTLSLILFIPEIILAIKHFRRRNDNNEENA